MFTQETVASFLDQLASSEPVPGGGSAAALGAALSAALLSMVCNLTIGKKAYKEHDATMREALERAQDLRQSATALMQHDTEAYTEVMQAYRLPKGTSEEQGRRQQAIEEALHQATTIPLRIAACCSDLITLSETVARHGNRWAVSDAGVAVLLAEASLHSALLNVDINLASIRDARFAQEARRQVEELLKDLDERKAQVLSMVSERMGT